MTALDTFFSSVRSIRGFVCTQLFFVAFAHLLFVGHMRREAQSHNALRDFIRHVGAPNLLRTDNSKTQTGKKWTQTKRKFVIKDQNTVPYNQRQNPAERKIRDIKHQSLLLLHQSGAPPEFWCYAVDFLVDIMNHLAHEPLNWRTPMEYYSGDTPDISNL